MSVLNADTEGRATAVVATPVTKSVWPALQRTQCVRKAALRRVILAAY